MLWKTPSLTLDGLLKHFEYENEIKSQYSAAHTPNHKASFCLTHLKSEKCKMEAYLKSVKAENCDFKRSKNQKNLFLVLLFF